MDREKGLVEVGSFCGNKECEEYGEVGKGNIIKYGLSKQGRQRYRCKRCKKAFNENQGTIFYRRRKAEKEILETLSLLSKGTSPSAIVESKGYKQETIQSWLDGAAKHVEQVSAALLQDYQVSEAQVDGLWSFVKHKGSKKNMKKAKKQEPSGGALSWK